MENKIKLEIDNAEAVCLIGALCAYRKATEQHTCDPKADGNIRRIYAVLGNRADDLVTKIAYAVEVANKH